MSHLEQGVFKEHIAQMSFYRRYVDDTFVICKSREDAELFLEKFNEGHPNIKFTIEHEENGSINFLDVKLSRNEDSSLKTSVHRKSLWSKQYIHFRSSTPISYKINLIKTLLFRAKKICSEEILSYEINNINDDLYNNGYPIPLNNKYCKEKGNAEKVPTVPKKPVFIQLQYKDEVIHNIITQRLKNAIKKTFFAAKLIILNKTRSMLRPSAKDKAPVLHTSNCIHEFTCICGSKYIGRTERCLSTCIKEHLPKWLMQSEEKIPKSSITKHLLDTEHSVDPKVAFRVINKQIHSKSLKYAEACAMRLHQPDLCIQKGMIVTLQLPW